MIETSERRKVARVIPSAHVHGRVLGGEEVRLLDLSPAGVCIEHIERLRPGTSCTLTFPLPLSPLRLTARVVWSQVRGGELTPEGERRRSSGKVARRFQESHRQQGLYSQRVEGKER